MKHNILLKEINKTSNLVEPLMFEYTFNYLNKIKGLCQKITYAFSEVGLRIRPFLLRMGYEAGGGDFKEIIPVAVSIEFMQLATLIIDDILDESQIRNNQYSINKKWGIKNAILLGDILKSLSMIILLRNINENKNFKGPNEVLRILENTYKDICIGQYLDLVYEKRKMISESEYFEMIKKTTAIFIQSSIKIGAILSGAPIKQVNSLSSYGILLGYAYQIRDDIIDLVGEEKYTGKPFAGDIKRRKKRLPFIHAFAHSSDSNRRRLEDIYRKDIIENNDVREIINSINKCGSIDYSIKKTHDFCEKAIESVEEIENSHVKKLLVELAKLISSFNN